MSKFILKKVLGALVLLVIGTGLTFLLVFSNTRGLVRQVLGEGATEEQIQARTEALGLNQPVLVQYGQWVADLLRGNLGSSYYTGEPVTVVLSSRIPVTLSVVITAVILMLILSVVVGVVAAVKGGWIDRVLQVGGILGGAIPGFIVAIILVFTLAVAIPLFPATGYVSPTDSVEGWIRTLVLPVTAVLVTSVAGAALQFRGAMMDALSQDYVRTLRARGVPETAIVLRHALRNAALPGLTTISLQTIGLMGGVVIIEKIFALPGVAAQLTTSAILRDIPIVMGAVLFTICVVVIVNILLALITGWINPKERVS
ncbi:ABC transporter permease [Microbacterium saperdae]|uniref:Peptide/nickel transport system permease protein n=1 Tax=Microbacterium saperdae TaxID=69368 RepID=A0A543BL46_9MICO|nr:ABC transporter permease [Microbacterium saperdae]TQL85557.1 peptide/nickel transport system permease protein [Microbacterium saperdae]GGM62831.1 ABC transporter permease [Microbacterium saperdae]